MSRPGAVLSGRIISELKELSLLAERIIIGWDKYRKNHDDYYLDSVALNLHGFYSSVERIFERIAITIDDTVPSGANWHQELLNQMTIEVPGIRPAVISSEVKDQLEEYRGFRHIVRNVYAYHFNPEKIENLVTGLTLLFSKFDAELKSFADFLRNVG
jgi:hypothetical protein